MHIVDFLDINVNKMWFISKLIYSAFTNTHECEDTHNMLLIHNSQIDTKTPT